MSKRARTFVHRLRSTLHARYLLKGFPQLMNYEQLVKSGAYHLRPVYDKYISDISTKNMVISWETSCFLYTIARISGAKKILDLGSGFSSYVLRSRTRTNRIQKVRQRTISARSSDSWILCFHQVVYACLSKASW